MKRIALLLLVACAAFGQPSGSGSGVATRFVRKTSDPATCTAGQVEFNITGASFKGCGSTNTWTAFSQSILSFAALNGDITGPSALTTTTGAGKAFTNQPANDSVTINSDTDTDTTQTVTIIGTTNGTDTVVVETIALDPVDGTSPVVSVKTDWGVILAVKLSATCAGTITITETSGSATITTIAPAATSKGVETVLAANQSAWNRTVNLVASGATTKQLGLKGTNSSGTVIYDSQALTGATAVLSNSAFATVTEIYTGDLEATRTATETATKGTKLDGLYIATTPSSLCTGGDVLTSTAGNGLLTCVPAAAGVTGTGTLNVIPRITNATGPVIGDSAITDDGTTVTSVRPVVVDTTADVILMTLTGHSTQTNQIFKHVTSAGNVKYAIEGTGNHLLASDMGVYWSNATNAGTIAANGDLALCRGGATTLAIDNADCVGATGSVTAGTYTSGGSTWTAFNITSTTGQFSLPNVSLGQYATGLVGPTDSSTPATVANHRDLGARHIIARGTVPTTVTGSCGTSPTFAGGDSAMLITTGSVAPTSCIVTFGTAFANAPICTANAQTTTTALNVVTTTTTVTVSAAALTASEKIYVLCMGY